MLTDTSKTTGYPSIDKPWLKYYSEEVINTPLPDTTIYEYMHENNKAYPNDIAINYLGRKITYKELFEKIDNTARAFQALDVKPGEIVTVALPSVPEALYVVYALNKIGAVANMIHPLAGREEILNYLNEVESRVAVIFDGTHDILKERIMSTSVDHAIIVTASDSLPFGVKQLYSLKNKKKYVDNGIYTTWKEFIKGAANNKLINVNKNPSTMAIISHTGGTTGEPKGVMCSDNNLNALMHQIVCNFDYGRDGSSLIVLPPFINYSLVEATMAMLAIGYVVILIPKYEPDRFIDYIQKHRPSVILSIPPYWEVLLKEEKKYDFSCFEHIYYGGEGMTEEIENRLNSYLLACGSKTPLCKGLGSTELMAAATQSFPECNPIGSVGIPLVMTNCKIVTPDTYNELPYEQHGEICFSGPSLMLGYYKNKEATDRIVRIHDDGRRWLHTGDLGYIDKDGLVYITGRMKRILVTKGTDGVATKMFPDRIEKVINEHPSVQLSCVIGVPDQERINYPKAVIELNEGSTPSKELEKEILQFCKGKLPEYQIPNEIEFIDSLPRTERGKIDYRALERSGH